MFVINFAAYSIPMKIFFPEDHLKKVVIIGGGFGGIELAKKLDPEKFRVILVDRHNYHTFQPLLYQVATGGLEPDSVAYPISKNFYCISQPEITIFPVMKNFPDRVGDGIRTSAATKCITNAV